MMSTPLDEAKIQNAAKSKLCALINSMTQKENKRKARKDINDRLKPSMIESAYQQVVAEPQLTLSEND